ncbi:MAG: CTP synthase [Candidatus Komeilibacteria bacterium]
MATNTKYIFVVGGVMSGVGKGITTASIGKILQSKGYRVTAIKIDPYVNVDAGTMNPTVHGEVFVTIDGDETDQDIGNYERFLNVDIPCANYMTTGRVYSTVIQRERNLGYEGKCVEVVPDVPNEIIQRVKRASRLAKSDFTIVEVGGTIGEYQNLIFLEAARMMKLKAPRDVLFILVSYLPIPAKVGEMKTKPTQYASRTLNSAGIQADFIICRASHPLDRKRREKIATFCNINADDAISAPDVASIYDVPVNFEKQQLGNKILDKFGLKTKKKDLVEWRRMLSQIKHAKTKVRVGIVGKYFYSGSYVLSDVYISVIEAIKHAGGAVGVKPELHWIDSAEFEKPKASLRALDSLDAVIVPGGFGSRGINGIIKAIEYCRKKKIPYLGLCYGMQLASVEFARNVANIKKADTVEIDPQAKDAVIHVNDKQAKNLAESNFGNSMRLGSYDCVLKEGTLARKLYGSRRISERHRHRYEFNNQYRKIIAKAGLIFSGICPDNDLVEIIELPTSVHPYFIASQFHPEFQSRPMKPHPLFVGLLRAAKKQK